jgi:histidine triad (HIT) family protein
VYDVSHGTRERTVTEPECFLCDITAGRAPIHLVWSDDEFVALLERYPITPGHLALVPRAHIDSVFDLPADAYARLFARARSLAAPVAGAAGAPRTGLAVEGFGVAHAHVHLVPVWRGGDLDPRRQGPVSEGELQRAAGRLRDALAEGRIVHG